MNVTPPPPAPARRQVGVVTSACQDAEGEWVGLGYIRSRIEGTQIALEGESWGQGGGGAKGRGVSIQGPSQPGPNGVMGSGGDLAAC